MWRVLRAVGYHGRERTRRGTGRSGISNGGDGGNGFTTERTMERACGRRANTRRHVIETSVSPFLRCDPVTSGSSESSSLLRDPMQPHWLGLGDALCRELLAELLRHDEAQLQLVANPGGLEAVDVVLHPSARTTSSSPSRRHRRWPRRPMAQALPSRRRLWRQPARFRARARRSAGRCAARSSSRTNVAPECSAIHVPANCCAGLHGRQQRERD